MSYSASRLTAFVLSILLLSTFTHAPAEARARWRHVLDKDGVKVSALDVPGRGFPTFRGVGLIKANLYEVLAVISDIKRYPEWVERCAEARLLKKQSELRRVVYQRTDAPWPVADRDSVNQTVVEVGPNRKKVNIRFWAVRDKVKPEVNGVVRMVNLRGHYLLKVVDDNTTLIDFKVDADPGGLIPKWMAKLAARKLPLRTVQRLREQVKRTRGWYAKRIKRWREDTTTF